MATPVRTALTTSSSKTSQSSVNTASVTVNAGEMLVVAAAYDDQTLNSVTWNGLELTLLDAVLGAGVRTRIAYLVVPSTASSVVTFTWAGNITAKAWAVSKFTNVNEVDVVNGNTGTSGTPTSNNITTTHTISALYGSIGTEGPSGDTRGTWQNTFTAGQRSGTTGNPAAGNVTVDEGFRIVTSGTLSVPAAKTGMTSRDWGAAIAAFVLRNRGYGQAQARISTPPVKAPAQAQANIKQVYKQSAQSQGFIGPRIYTDWTLGDNSSFTNVAGNALHSITFGNGYWVGVSASAEIAYNLDPPTDAWTIVNTALLGDSQPVGIHYANDYFVAVHFTQGAGRIAYAHKTPVGGFTENVSAQSFTFDFRSVSYGAPYWVAVGGSGQVAYTTDPTGTWTLVDAGFGTSNIQRVWYANGVWVIVGNNGKMATATDPTGTWTLNTDHPWLSTETIGDVKFGNGLWVAVGATNNGKSATATDPTGTWTQGDTFTTFPAVFVQGPYLAYGNYGTEGGVWVTIGQNDTSLRARISVAIHPELPGGWSNDIGAHNFLSGGDAHGDPESVWYANGYWVVGGTQASTAQHVLQYNQNPIGNYFTPNAQAQALIAISATESNGYAQAQAQIRQTYNGFSQAQTNILAVSNGFGQAQATIAGTGGGAIAFVAERANFGSSANSASHAVPISNPTAITVGNALIMRLVLSGGATTVSITDPRGNTWNEVPSIASNSPGYTTRILYAVVTNGYQTSDELTIELNTGRFATAVVDEFSGLTSTPFDVSAERGDTGTTEDPNLFDTGNTATTAQADELFIGALGSINAYTVTPEILSPAWQELGSSASTSTVRHLYGHYRIVSSTGTYKYAGTLSTTGQDGEVIATFKGSGAAGPTVSNSHAQAQAQILQVYQGFGQAQAQIKQTYIGVAQAQSRIKQAYNSFAQTQAQIKVVGRGFAQSKARIARLIAYDLFDRTVASGFGTSTDGNINWGVQQETISDSASVDGAVGAVGADTLTYMHGYPYISEGMIQFDVQIPTDQISIYFDTLTERIAVEYFDVNDFEFSDYFGTLIIVDGLSVGDWVTCKMIVSLPGQPSALKAWKRGTPEPDWTPSQSDDATSTFGTNGSDVLFDTLFETDSIHFDNLYIWTFVLPQMYLKESQAQALIIRTEQSYGQAQAAIRKTEQGYGQSRATIKAIGNGFAQSQARIKQSYNSFAQSQARTLRTYNQFSQAQGLIKRTHIGVSQTQALIVVTALERIGQAQAFIAGLYGLPFEDSFNRVAINSLGVADNGDTWILTQGSSVNASANGSQGVLIGDFQRWDLKQTLIQTNSRGLQISGLGSVDKLPTDSGVSYFVIGVKNEESSFKIGAGLVVAGFNQRIGAVGVVEGSGQLTNQADYTPNDIYHFKVQIIGASDTFDIFNFKSWKTGDIEPDWFSTVIPGKITFPIINTVRIFTPPVIDVNEPFTWSFSNLKIEPIDLGGYGQAQAYIYIVKSLGVGHAQAQIRTDNIEGFSQAQARIKGDGALVYLKDTFTRSQSGQVTLGTPDIGSPWENPWDDQTDTTSIDGSKLIIPAFEWIEPRSNIPHSYVDASIDFRIQNQDFDIEIYFDPTFIHANSLFIAYSQFDERIDLSVQGDGNDIIPIDSISLNTWYTLKGRLTATQLLGKVWEVGTPEPDWMVRVTPNEPSNGIEFYMDSGAELWIDNILVTENLNLQYSQAQALIIGAVQTYGQSQASIQTTYNAFSQAQASIKAVGYGFAQSQATVRQIYQGYGQAQGQIKQTYQSYAQANADILKTYSQFAQAQASISAVSNGFAQSQARILTSYYSLAQAQARLIAFAVNGYGQALANIKGTDLEGLGQAQAYIHAFNIEGLGQSQALILQTYQGYAQAHAQITQTYQQNGQAQADILQVYNGYAQAQASIKQTYNSFAQTQAQIKQTYQEYGQAQASIKTTYNGYGQAQGSILTSYQSYAQAQANIKQTYLVFAQSQAWIEQTYNEFAQAQARITQTYQEFAQAQASILTSYQAYAQSQGQIKQTYNGYGQSNADIKQTYQRYGQTQADILVTYYGFAQAQAVILSTYNEFGQANASIKAIGQGYGQAQAKINAFGVQRYGQANANIAGTTFPSGQAQAKINAFNVTEYAQSQAAILAASNGYGQTQGSIKTTYNGYGQSQANILVITDGYAQAQGQIKQTYQSYAEAQANIKTSYQEYAQSQATIKTTYNGFGQAQSDIKQTYQEYGQAQASIRTSYLGFAQSQAWIETTTNDYGQAQGQIKQIYQQYANAQAEIKQTYLGFAQAQSTILQTYQGYAQAQACIKGNAFAQAQAFIIVGSTVYGQAQALIASATLNASAQAQGTILAVDREFGQANANIRVTTNRFAQAQGNIKQTYQGYAQSNAWIEQTFRGYAQAQGRILATNNGAGQSNADILQTYNQFAQARGSIKQTYQGYAQVQGLIVRSAQGYGQTQALIGAISYGAGQAQARILALSNVYAQAQAHVSTQQIVFAQAQAYVLAGAAYAQARAYIRALHLLKKLAISDRSVNLTLTDRDSTQQEIGDSGRISLTLSDRETPKFEQEDTLVIGLAILDRNYEGV